MKALIEQRKKEDFIRLNKDKINSSPFTDKIDAIKAIVEKQLRKLRELEGQDKEWKANKEAEQQRNNEYENAYEDYYSKPSGEHQPLKGTSKLSFQPSSMNSSFMPTSEPEKRIQKALLKPLDTDIFVDDLTQEERIEMGNLLKVSMKSISNHRN